MRTSPFGLLALICLTALATAQERTRAEEPARPLYPSLLRSTAYVIGDRLARASVTGWLVDSKRRLLVTHLSTVGDDEAVNVVFPSYHDGKLVVERAAYVKAKGKGMITGRVVHREPRCGLAVLELDFLPEGVVELKLAETSAEPGDAVHVVGNPHKAGALWVLNAGAVRQVYHRKAQHNTYEIDARVLETQTPFNPGDCGGPVVNDKGELVGVVESVAVKAQLVTFCIDVSEVRQIASKARDLAAKQGPRAPTVALVDLLGVRVVKPPSVLVEQLGLPPERGLLVEHVRPNSAAEMAGVKLHDILLELDGKPLSDNVSAFPAALAALKPNTPVTALVVRKGRQETIKTFSRPAD